MAIYKPEKIVLEMNLRTAEALIRVLDKSEDMMALVSDVYFELDRQVREERARREQARENKKKYGWEVLGPKDIAKGVGGE